MPSAGVGGGDDPRLPTGALGLEPDGFSRKLTVRRPWLPETVGDVELRGIPIAGGEADLRFTRVGDETRAEVIDARGVQVDLSEAEPKS